MKRILQFFLFLAFLVSATSCDDFLDINDDPLAATQADPDLLFPTALLDFSMNRTVENTPSFAAFAQHWASGGSAGVFISPERYIIGVFGPGNTWVNNYASVLKNMLLARLDAEAAGRNNVVAQIKIVEAMTYLYLTTTFGDIPFTEAVDLETANPRFDPQEVVLDGIVARLDEALALIDLSSTDAVRDGDLIYKGDIAKWQRYANSLKFKTLMLIQNKKDVSAQIAATVTQPMITSVADEAAFPYFDAPNNQNPIWKITLLFSGGQNVWFHANNTTLDLMNALDDPRIPTYFDTNGAGAYRGIAPGSAAGAFSDNFSTVSGNIIRADFPDRLTTAGEILLLQAEAAAKGIIPGGLGAANDLYRQGVQASMDFYNGKPGAIPAAAKTAYLNSLPNLASRPQAAALEAIYAQQYLDLFGRGIEAWTQWRRVKFPELTLPIQAQLGTIIRRYPYAVDELAANINAPSQPTLDSPMWFEN
ncbi:MAG: SusD/RagB family nutrient-binding outer membrane lipoprotein [Bernardetiaceae bacterium]